MQSSVSIKSTCHGIRHFFEKLYSPQRTNEILAILNGVLKITYLLSPLLGALVIQDYAFLFKWKAYKKISVRTKKLEKETKERKGAKRSGLKFGQYST